MSEIVRIITMEGVGVKFGLVGGEFNGPRTSRLKKQNILLPKKDNCIASEI
jgi:hypothetical protein